MMEFPACINWGEKIHSKPGQHHYTGCLLPDTHVHLSLHLDCPCLHSCLHHCPTAEGLIFTLWVSAWHLEVLFVSHPVTEMRQCNNLDLVARASSPWGWAVLVFHQSTVIATWKHMTCWHALEGTIICPQGHERIYIWFGFRSLWCFCVSRTVDFFNVLFASLLVSTHNTVSYKRTQTWLTSSPVRLLP